MSRPNPFQWIAYVYGARLPESKHEWILNDLTGRFAVPRHLLRAQLAFVPVYLVFFFAFQGEIGLRLAMVALSMSLSFIFCVVYMDQNRARRLQKHGFDPNAHTQRRQAELDAEKAEYEAIYASRRASAAS